MAIEAASLFKTLMSQARVEVALSADLALSQAGISAPVSGEKFPGDR